MARYCPNCGEPVTEDDAFCGECGTSLGGGQGGGAGQDDQQESGWEENDSGWEENDSGWDDQQDSGWNDQQGGSRRTGRGGSGAGQAPALPRKGAIDTFTQGLEWLIGIPALAGAFILVDIIGNLGGLVSGVLSFVGWILSLIVWGVAYRYTEQLAFGEQVPGDVDALVETASDVTGRLLSLIGISIIYFIAVFIGLILLIIPGIYIGARLILAFPACILGDQGVSDSLSTGWDLGEGNVLKLFGIFLINMVVVFGISALASIFGGLSALESPVVLLITAPVTGILGGAVQMAVARVYLENRGGRQQPPAQQQPADYQNTSEW